MSWCLGGRYEKPRQTSTPIYSPSIPHLFPAYSPPIPLLIGSRAAVLSPAPGDSCVRCFGEASAGIHLFWPISCPASYLLPPAFTSLQPPASAFTSLQPPVSCLLSRPTPYGSSGTVIAYPPINCNAGLCHRVTASPRHRVRSSLSSPIPEDLPCGSTSSKRRISSDSSSGTP